MKKKVNTMLEDDTIEHLTKEAKEKSISVSAVIRQKVEGWYKEWTPDPHDYIKVGENEYMNTMNKTDRS